MDAGAQPAGASARRGAPDPLPRLPTKSPWLNPIEPHWVHAKRRIIEPARVLTAAELEARVYAAFGCPRDEHLVISKEVACIPH